MSNPALSRAIGDGAARLGQALPDAAADALAHLIDELERWNARLNLTAIRDPADMVPGHVLDSLTLRPHLDGEAVIDIGTGAGFPGLPLAVAEPGRQFVLLDSNRRKTGFVEHMIGELGLANASAVCSRAEDYRPGRRFDSVVARAVTSCSGLIRASAHLLGEGGVLLAMKGKAPIEELQTLPADWSHRTVRLDVPGLEGKARHLVRLIQTGPE